jgi:hypothetical protein
MDIYHGYVAWIYLDMSGYLLDFFSGYLFLDMSEKISYFAQRYPRDILHTISNDTQRYPTISRDIQMGQTPRLLTHVVTLLCRAQSEWDALSLPELLAAR